MEKNTIWAIALSTVVLVGFFAVQTIFFPVRKAQEQSHAAQQQVVQEQAASAADSGSAVSAFGGIVSDGEAVAEDRKSVV